MKQEFSTTAFLWRATLVLATFVGVGLLIASRVTHAGAIHHTPLAQVRLAAMMAGLFGGGAAAVIVLLILAFGSKRKPQGPAD